MVRLLDFIEKHKYGIVATMVVHLALFIYFQVGTYQQRVLFEPWDFKGKQIEAPDDIEITADQIETPQEQELFQPNEKISSFVKDENDERDRSFHENEHYTSSAEQGKAEDIEDDYEQELKDKIREERKAKEAENRAENEPREDVETKQDKTPTRNWKEGARTSDDAVAGQTMVSFSLQNRHPLNHNDWHVRNPGYTCGEVNGTVKVAITVDDGGNVTNAKILEQESQNASHCMKQKAREYALMSRFNYDKNAPNRQEGVITYRFVYNR